MSTLAVVEEVLRETRTPLVVREIVEIAGARLPTRSRTPDTVVARDLAMDIKRRGEQSLFARVAPGRYTLREYANLARGTGEIQVVEAPAPAAIAPLPVPPPATPVVEPVQG
jgi:hypothetical protein